MGPFFDIKKKLLLRKVLFSPVHPVFDSNPVDFSAPPSRPLRDFMYRSHHKWETTAPTIPIRNLLPDNGFN